MIRVPSTRWSRLRHRSPRGGAVALCLTAAMLGSLACASKSSAPPPVTRVTILPSVDTLLPTQTVALAAQAYDAAGGVVSGVTFTWSVDSTAVVSVSGTGSVNALRAGGPATITAKTEGISGTATILVSAVPVASVKVVPASPSVNVGLTVQLIDTVKDSIGDVLTGRTVTWSSADTTVAKVSQSGLVTGIAAGGPITITATSGSKSGTAAVTVNAGALAFVSISAGDEHTCALTAAGVGYCWGADDQSQLGNNYYPTDIPFATAVLGGHTFASIHAAGRYTCAVTTGGTAYCWGVTGRLGNNTNVGSGLPSLVAGSLVVDSMSSGNASTCVLTTGGTTYCWGDNLHGEAGDNVTETLDSIPTTVVGGHTFIVVNARGDFHACALVSGGAAYCWGDNSYGQLGNGASTAGPDSVPTAAATLLTFTSIATGGKHTCGIATSGTTYCWGSDLSGELGDGQPVGLNPAPSTVSGGHTFVSVVAGESFSCGLTSAGAAYCWGDNSYEQLGNNSTTSSNVPVAVSGGLTFATITAGSTHVCGITTGGVAYCWGDNNYGELGNNTTTSSGVPVAILTTPPPP